MRLARFAAVLAAAGMVLLGCAACGEKSPAGQPDELSQIQRTLDSVDADMAGDDEN